MEGLTASELSADEAALNSEDEFLKMPSVVCDSNVRAKSQLGLKSDSGIASPIVLYPAGDGCRWSPES